MKKALDEIKSEVTVLDRTKQILTQKDAHALDMLHKIEKEKGITGYSEVEDNIQLVSENKEKADNIKQ